MKASKSLEKIFRDNDKELRTWPTWKLKSRSVGLDGEDILTAWDRMSKRDQEFNLAFNELIGVARELSAAKLDRLLSAAKLIKTS